MTLHRALVVFVVTRRAGHVKIQTPAQEVCPSPRLPVTQAS